MGRRGNQSFLKNQKAQKRVARANAKRAEKQARRDDKAARAATGESGPPIAWSEEGEERPGNGAAPGEHDDELETRDDDDEDDGEDEDEDDEDGSKPDSSVTTH